MFTPEEWQALLRKLLQQTREGRVDWNFDTDGVYDATVGRFSYTIGSSDDDGRAPYYLAVIRGTPIEGEELDRIESTEPVLTLPTFGIPSQASNFAMTNATVLVSVLRDAVVRHVEGGAELALSLLADLDELSGEVEPEEGH